MNRAVLLLLIATTAAFLSRAAYIYAEWAGEATVAAATAAAVASIYFGITKGYR